jgi:spore germination protein KC
MKKSLALIMILIISTMLLSGCWDYREVEHLAIVAGCAVDKSTNGKLYHLTVEVFETSGTKDSTTKSKLLESDGLTFFDAIRNALNTSHAKLYWSNCQIVIISKDIATDGIVPVLDYFLRGHEIRPTIKVLISQETTAREIITQKRSIPTVISFDVSSSLLANPQNLSTTQSNDLIKIANTLEGEGTALTLPAIRNTTNGDSVISELNGVAIFDKDKLIGFLNPDDTKYFLFAKDEIKGGTITGAISPGPRGIITGEIFESSTKIKPDDKDGVLTMSIKTKTTVSLVEQGIGNTNNADELLDTSADRFARFLEENISRVIAMVQTTYGQDIFGFGSVLSKENPKLWAELKLKWNETFRNIGTEVVSEITIRDSGRMES